MKILIVTSLVVLIYFLLPNKKSCMETTSKLLETVPDNHYEDLCEYVPDGPKSLDPAFWEISAGVDGILLRLRTSFIYMRVVQAYRRDGAIDLSDAAIVGNMLLSQTFYSLLALPEAALDYIWKRQHAHARHALGIYCELLLRTNSLCFSATSNKCPIKLLNLL